MSESREQIRERMMSAAHSVLDNLHDLINDDTFTVDDVREEIQLLMALVTVGRSVSGDDPYSIAE